MNNKVKHIKTYSILLFCCVLIFVCFLILDNDIIAKCFYNNPKTEKKQQFKSVIKEKEEIINSLNLQIAELKKTEETSQRYKEITAENVNNLLKAKEYFNSDEYEESLSYIEKVDVNLLIASTKTIYDNMLSDCLKNLGKKYYSLGYHSYINKDYNESIELFQKSYHYEKNQSFSSDALYLLGYSLYQVGKYEDAKLTFEMLLKEYPKTSTRKDVERILSNF